MSDLLLICYYIFLLLHLISVVVKFSAWFSDLKTIVTSFCPSKVLEPELKHEDLSNIQRRHLERVFCFQDLGVLLEDDWTTICCSSHGSKMLQVSLNPITAGL